MTPLFMKQSIKATQGRPFRKLPSGDWGPCGVATADALEESSSQHTGILRRSDGAEPISCASRPDFTSVDLDAGELDVWFPWSSRHSECIFSPGSLLSKLLNALAPPSEPSRTPHQKRVLGGVVGGGALPTLASDVGSR